MSISKTAALTLGFLSCACGAEAGSTGEAALSADQPTSGEVDQVRQHLGEATCATTAPDETWDLTTQSEAISKDGNYDHSTCRNAFIVDIGHVTAGRRFIATNALTKSNDPFSCLFTWGYISLWQKQPSGYVKIADNVALGTFGGLPQIGNVCIAGARTTIPVDGDYRIIASSGVFFGPYLQVDVLPN